MTTSTVATGLARRAARLAALTLAVGTLSSVGTAALAQNSNDTLSQPPVTVHAPRVVQPPSFVTYGMGIQRRSLTRYVSYVDLNLDTPEGKVALHQRIRDNARAACLQLETRYPSSIWVDDVQSCVQQAMLTWMPVVHGIPAAVQQ